MSESFDWNSPGLEWSHFHSLTNLLSLRNGGQAEPSSLSDTVLVDDWDFDEKEDGDTHSMNTGLAHQISGSEHGRLKRRFLDCLAEFAANKQGGRSVACSAMKEAEDNVLIWIARNEGFSDVDKVALGQFGKRLSSLFCNDATQADQSEAVLWEEMVLYHQNRIEHNYIPNLRASFKAYDAAHRRKDTNTVGNSSVSDAPLSDLRTLLFDRDINGTSTFEKYTRLVIVSYNLRRIRSIEEILNSGRDTTSESKSLWWDICLLARLRVAFQNFKDVALTLPSFKQITIIPVLRPPSPENPSQRPLKLKQTFDLLHCDLNPDTTKAVLGQKWTVAKIEREFAKRQKQRPNVHAEVQMLMFLNTNESPTSGLFQYFGCSKLSCFMCGRFLRSYGRFTTRGCHGRLFKPWTVPSVDRLLPGQANRIAKALISVQKEVKKELKAPVEDHLRLERTSVIGGSSVLDGRQEELSQRQLLINRLKMKVERERVIEMFRRQTEHPIDSARRTPSTLKVNEPDECDVCSRPTTRRCEICKKGFFCSDLCQEKRSGRHLFECSKRRLTSADYLWMSMAEDLIPEDEDVLEDFGFINFPFPQERTKLFGVYRGLWLSGNFSAEDIHEWRVAGILVDKIKEFYYGIAEGSRGQYFPWFLKNVHLLEHIMTKDEAQQKLIATFYDKARPYLDIEDGNKTARDLEPEAKDMSYHLLAQVLRRYSPNPIQREWYSFGFVTCCGHDEEVKLVDLYQLLLTESDGSFFYEFHNRRRSVTQPATFTEFWKAYEAGKLIQLMDSKGLKELRSWLPLLEGFLSVPPAGPHPSVWDLKQFLEIDDPMDHRPIPAVGVDYGFINCATFEETCFLMEIYKKVLESANPLDLHQACVTGDLFQFASDYVRMDRMDTKWKSLMRNPYPLKEELEESELGSEVVGSGADKDPADLLLLLSRLGLSVVE